MNKNQKQITEANANAVGVNCVRPQNSKGITLIALIITIIVMLILVGVSVTIAINGGLFDTTKKAAKETEEAKRKEQELASGRIKIDEIWYDSLEDYAIGKESDIQGVVDLDASNTEFIYEPSGWTNGEVKVKINTVTSGFTLQYSTDGINWKNYTTEIPINKNGVIYAKLVDSEGNEGGTITGNVKNIDTEGPTINTDLNSTGAVETTIPLSIKVTDNVSGISKIEWCYKLDTESTYTTLIDTYTEMNGSVVGEKREVTKTKELSGLTSASTYNIYAVVYDVAGNSTRSPETGTINIETEEVIIPPEIGDYVNYEPDVVSASYSLGTYSGYSSSQTIAQEQLNWQVLKIHEDGSIDLIGTPTPKKVYFKGALGYNNAVYLLHDICEKLYSKPSEGIIARSVSLEDFEDEDNGGNWKSTRDAFISVSVQYNKAKTYADTTCTYYPSLYAQENGSGINTTLVKTNGIKDTDKYYTTTTTATYSHATTSLTVTQTYYSIEINEANYGKSAKVLSQSNTYWLATRFSECSSYPFFGVRISDSNLSKCRLYDGYNRGYSYSECLRPVVSLSSSAKLTLISEGADGTNTFNITKY